MHILQIQDVCFDDEATRVTGAAFDRACSSIGHFARAGKVRELIASRIIEAAKNGERDPAQIHSEAMMGFSINSALIPIVSVARRLARGCVKPLSEKSVHARAPTPDSTAIQSAVLVL